MSSTVLLITPPFTQLNTPYPATAYLKGFLNTKQITSYQADLGIEVTNAIFNKKGLAQLFNKIDQLNIIKNGEHSINIQRIIALKDYYISTIDEVILFLQGKNSTMAHLISKRNYLPEAARFNQVDDLDWAFGSMGIQDRAKHLATMYLEDLSDLIKETVDPYFGFSRYAEKLGRSANKFDELYNTLQEPLRYVDEILLELLANKMEAIQPHIVAISVPFPGNLYASLRCGQWIKKQYPNTKVLMGGGFANTELRSLTDARVFEFFDFICLDDGEAPIESIIEYILGNKKIDELKRTFALVNGRVTYFNNANCKDYKQGEVGTPDYSNLLLDQYISAIEVVNPMHRMWSDGRWNKLTMAHGCYWGKCTFCDISLDYIKLYEPIAAQLLCDRMETLIAQTGQNGFHFVDEAAPPALMRELALEIIKRKLVVSWWTNVRFEKSFTRDLCLLLRESGCIAVSGGLEVASDRLLLLIQKGITVAQVARVTRNLTEAGIMVHAYLMYGFPTQTEQETIDSLEMTRQMFKLGILQSAFWHLFTMTAHSPVGMDPAKYNVRKLSNKIGSFANNDIDHIDLTGADHTVFGFGLAKSLLNYMHGTHLDDPLHKWFDFKVPKTSIDPNYIANILNEPELTATKPTAKVIWMGKYIDTEIITKSKKGSTWEIANLSFVTKKSTIQISVGKAEGEWLASMLTKLFIQQAKTYTLQEVKEDFKIAGLDNFELFWDNKPVSTMYKIGLLVL